MVWGRPQFRGHFWQSSKLVDLVLSRSYMSYCILFWGPSKVSRAILSFIKTRGFGPFSQLYELLHCFGVHRQFRGHFWQSSKVMDFDICRSYMSYCILFWGPSIVSRAILAIVKTPGFGHFSQLYELLHIVLGPSIVLRAFLAVMKTSGFDPFSQFYEQ